MITKSDFLKYYKVQMGGRYNMVMDANYAMNAAQLSNEKYWDIILNYAKYYDEFIN